jgi:hypothetical protein
MAAAARGAAGAMARERAMAVMAAGRVEEEEMSREDAAREEEVLE